MMDEQKRLIDRCLKFNIGFEIDDETSDWILKNTVILYFRNFPYPKKGVCRDQLANFIDEMIPLISQIPDVIDVNILHESKIIEKALEDTRYMEKLEPKLITVKEEVQNILSKIPPWRKCSIFGQDLTEQGEQYTGFHVKHMIKQRLYVLYKKSKINHCLTGPGFMYGDYLVFHKDFSFTMTNKEASKVIGNLRSFDICPFEGNKTSFYERTLLTNFVYRILYYLEEKLMTQL